MIPLDSGKEEKGKGESKGETGREAQVVDDGSTSSRRWGPARARIGGVGLRFEDRGLVAAANCNTSSLAPTASNTIHEPDSEVQHYENESYEPESEPNSHDDLQSASATDELSTQTERAHKLQTGYRKICVGTSDEGREIASIERNKTWNLTELPSGHRPIGLKWIYKIKKDAKGKITRHKARLIAKGYIQEHVTGSSQEMITQFKLQKERKFGMSDLGLLTHYLGLEVIQDETRVKVTMRSYAKNILRMVGPEECNATKLPMEPGVKLMKDDGSKKVDATEYRKVIGCLRYLTRIRPDLLYSVGYTSKYMQEPNVTHQHAVKQILRYVKGALNLGIHYQQKGKDGLMGHSDLGCTGTGTGLGYGYDTEKGNAKIQ
ncbi:hypothetical protein E3N88_29636 [Mikania micrantha]|uniref:Reverse transcriptase Ty1/copia-type domain-containing protein n=1 Tax=Mikania micrantha TaxID=192012 RepID=A0A5N6MJT8_9ASTR|nr:hypothetical protein E3N88_29636 [Mikania micrantha]